jgi:hypothetical protein
MPLGCGDIVECEREERGNIELVERKRGARPRPRVVEIVNVRKAKTEG